MAICRPWEPTPRVDASISTIPTGTTAEAGKKHQRVLALGAALPGARNVVAQDLTASGLTRERLLATAFRLLDAGHFRIGGEVYAESNGSYGLSTLRREHVRRQHGLLVFEYIAKSGVTHTER